MLINFARKKAMLAALGLMSGLMLFNCRSTFAAAAAEKITWLDFDAGVFERAKKEDKLILLDLEAVWCHWCHVMDEETYQNADVIKLLKSKYLCVRVDQDSRPDLSNKYEQYGWPATIIFDGQGHELAKEAGFINAVAMRKLLKDAAGGGSKIAVAAPVAVVDQAPESKNFDGLLPALKESLLKKHKDGYDTKYGGWGKFQKFLDFDSAEFAMVLGLAGDQSEALQARGALDGELNLLDPAFGGLYQYSTDGDWQHPHFEKVMAIQADGMRLYSLGYLLYKDPKYLQAAQSIAAYLDTYLSSADGAFYTSQDADLKAGEHSGDYFQKSKSERLALGLPRIDKHVYSRENGLAICALTYLYRASGEKAYLDRALAAIKYVQDNRGIAGSPGGFRHDQADKAGPYLSDSLAMGRAFLSLYEVTADRQWLEKAKLCAAYIDRHFQIDNQSGYVTAVLPVGSPVTVPALLDENVMLSRFANLLYQYTGKTADRDISLRALRYLSLPDVYEQRRIFVGGILLADSECHASPLHITVVGSKDDTAAAGLFKAAIQLPYLYKRVEWFDVKEGPLPNTDLQLPQLEKAAAFSCGGGRCSRPAFTPVDLIKMVTRLAASN